MHNQNLTNYPTKYFRIKENSFIARLAAWKLGAKSVAIVIGETIHLHHSTREDFLANRQWFRHELTHIEQFKQYGWLKCIFLYLAESARNGYHNNRFEIEARQSENDTDLETPYKARN